MLLLLYFIDVAFYLHLIFTYFVIYLHVTGHLSVLISFRQIGKILSNFGFFEKKILSKIELTQQNTLETYYLLSLLIA